MSSTTIPNSLNEAITVSVPITETDKVLTLETGRLANLADGSVVARIGDTQVLVTATAANRPRPFADFFPLTVDIEERMYAAGRIPGSFFRREGRASDEAILTCRLIDRPLRPNFPEGFRHDTHIVGTVLGVDGVNPYDLVALNGGSAALWISGIPFESPVAAVRIAYTTDGTWIPFPTYAEAEAATFEMVVAGRQIEGGEIAIMMVEAGGTERSFEYFQDGAPKVSEEVLTTGLEASKRWINDIINLQHELRSKVVEQNGEIDPMDWIHSRDYSDRVFQRVQELAQPQLLEIMAIADKAERLEAEAAAKEQITEQLMTEFTQQLDQAKNDQANTPDSEELASDLERLGEQIAEAIRTVTKQVVRGRIINDGFRIDGRATDEVRPLAAHVSYLGTAHGSALFQRGETQVLNVTTLGMTRMEQPIDTLNPETRKRYMHHYNFPPFSTGEAGFMRGPKRREIGHGALAERALLPVVPGKDKFPYALRLVSDVLSSNGSTSMASVCASSMSLMDAGVPVHDHVAGVAMGLVHADGRYVTLTDILGAEDAYGDMDFKVAGTADTITALQLDTKIEGIPADVLSQALAQARTARLHILDVMREAIPEPRPDVSENAPKIVSFEIPVEKIADLIGPRGKVINTLQEETGTEITVDEEGAVGIVSISAANRDAVLEARRQAELLVNPPSAELGATYQGRVVNITKFGAFINVLPGTDGLLHISRIGGSRRLESVEEVLQLGDVVNVVVDDIDRNGKISLSQVDGDNASSAADSAASSDTSAEASVAAPEVSEGTPAADGPATDSSTDESPVADSPVTDKADSLVGAAASATVDGAANEAAADTAASASGVGGDASPASEGAKREYVSFEDHFEKIAHDTYGDLGKVPQYRSRRGRRRSPRRS